MTWQEIDGLPPDTTELNDEERAQFDETEKYLVLEKAIILFGF